MKLLSVIGSGDLQDEATYEAARAVGRGLAEVGWTILCGGLGGVMEAVCRGAKEGGGITIGLLPGVDPREANRWVDLPITTGAGEARNVACATSGRVVVAIAGSYGTLTEIAFALKYGRPVIALGSWRLDPARLDPGATLIHVETPEAVLAEVARLGLRAGRKPG